METYSSRVSDLRVEYDIHADFKSLAGTVTALVEGSAGKKVSFKASLGQETVFNGEADVDDSGKAKVSFHVNEPKLWYPHGYGAQPLYDVEAAVLSGEGQELHCVTRRVGFRKGELIQEPDDVGKSFYFRVNGVDVFCGGSDWIPADSFTPRVTEDRYRKWIQMMVDGYQVMIR